MNMSRAINIIAAVIIPALFDLILTYPVTVKVVQSDRAALDASI